jgi:hypothetical protein
MMDVRYWNIRRDGWLVIRPGIRPTALYVSFDPVRRRFYEHRTYPLGAVEQGTPIDPAYIDPRAVAEATAYSLLPR